MGATNMVALKVEGHVCRTFSAKAMVSNILGLNHPSCSVLLMWSHSGGPQQRHGSLPPPRRDRHQDQVGSPKGNRLTGDGCAFDCRYAQRPRSARCSSSSRTRCLNPQCARHPRHLHSRHEHQGYESSFYHDVFKHLSRAPGNAVPVIAQKNLTCHPKGGVKGE